MARLLIDLSWSLVGFLKHLITKPGYSVKWCIKFLFTRFWLCMPEINERKDKTHLCRIIDYVTIWLKNLNLINLFSFSFQNFIPLKEMRLVRSACFPSCTKTDGMETAQLTTRQWSVFGVQLEQNMSMNSGDTARPLVSTKVKYTTCYIWFY